MAFDLGAQGDAGRAAENGILLPWPAASEGRQPEELARLMMAVLPAPLSYRAGCDGVA